MREKLSLLSCYGPLFHRPSTLPIPFSGLQSCLRPCSEVLSVVWRYPTEKPRRFSKVFEVVKETGWKQAVVKRRTVFRSSSCFLEGNAERVGWLGPLLASGQNGGWYNVVRRHGFLPYVPTCILKGDGFRFSSIHCFRSLVDVNFDDVFMHQSVSFKASDEAVNLRMVVPIVSTFAPPSKVAIKGVALKVKVQEIIGGGVWCRGFLVQLMASCLAGSTFEVQPENLNIIDKQVDKGDIQGAFNTHIPSGVTLNIDDRKADDLGTDHPQAA
ncbi:hypothetical protein V6N13_126509 [Hibiscus sabdariffa]